MAVSEIPEENANKRGKVSVENDGNVDEEERTERKSLGERGMKLRERASSCRTRGSARRARSGRHWLTGNRYLGTLQDRSQEQQ